jgi:hypothetical protein
MEIADIEKNYAKLSDNDIIRIATIDDSGFRPEV